MDLTPHFQRQLEYDTWANREVVAALKAGGDQVSASVRLLAHVLGAEHVWLARLKGVASPVAVWPEFSTAECERQIADLHRMFSDYFRTELPSALDRTLTYKNTKGEAWSSRVDDILTHVFLHSAYHRGQIALQMRQAGQTPAYTDFIHGARQELFHKSKS